MVHGSFTVALSEGLDRADWGSVLDQYGLAHANDEPKSGNYVVLMSCDRAEQRARIMRAAMPGSPRKLGSVVLMESPNLEVMRELSRLGAACIVMPVPTEKVVETIRMRAEGAVRLPAGVLAAMLQDSPPRLTEREEMVLWYWLGGLSQAAIADVAHYSERHVRRILSAVFAKAGSRDKAHLAETFGSSDALRQQASLGERSRGRSD